MKKLLSIAILLCLMLTLLAGCGGNDDGGKPSDTAKTNELVGSWKAVSVIHEEDGKEITVPIADLGKNAEAQSTESNPSGDAPAAAAAPASSEPTMMLRILRDSTWDFHEDGTFSMTFLGDTKEYFEKFQREDPEEFQDVIDATNGTWVKKGVSPLGGTLYTLTGLFESESPFELTVNEEKLSLTGWGELGGSLNFERVK